ncbi:MAG TPA: tRNA-dihydrouridine synthase, partial [Arenicellales bacterium]|nr:tRNA-dihydrouridine synthase [Arenicellales bacterium]
AAQGRPWLLGQIRDHLDGGKAVEPEPWVRADAMLEHVEALHAFYGESMGVRIARKHISWYTKTIEGGDVFWNSVNRLEKAKEQKRALKEFLSRQMSISMAA